jgi:hypothetical protein
MHFIDSLLLLNDSAVDAHNLQRPVYWIADNDEAIMGLEFDQEPDVIEIWRRCVPGIIYARNRVDGSLKITTV